MSTGKFTRSRYEADGGVIYPIRIQPETIIGTFNPAPAGAVNGNITVRVGGSRRQYGILARTVRLKWTGTVPDGYDPAGVLTIPVLTPGAYNDISAGQQVTYQGGQAEVIGKSPERVR